MILNFSKNTEKQLIQKQYTPAFKITTILNTNFFLAKSFDEYVKNTMRFITNTTIKIKKYF